MLLKALSFRMSLQGEASCALGTNTHLVLEEAKTSDAVTVDAVVFKRQAFSWQQRLENWPLKRLERRHALLQRNLKTPEGVQVFAQPFAGKLLQLVSHTAASSRLETLFEKWKRHCSEASMLHVRLACYRGVIPCTSEAITSSLARS